MILQQASNITTNMAERRRKRASSKTDIQQWQLLGIIFFLSSSSAFTHSSQSRTTVTGLFSEVPRQRVAFINKRPFDFKKERERLRRTRYQRKRIPDTEKEVQSLRKERQAEFDRLMEKADARGESPSIWSFESLFPGTVIDTESVHRDLYGAKERDIRISSKRSTSPESGLLWKNPILSKRKPSTRIGSREEVLPLSLEDGQSEQPISTLSKTKVAASKDAEPLRQPNSAATSIDTTTVLVDQSLTPLVDVPSPVESQTHLPVSSVPDTNITTSDADILEHVQSTLTDTANNMTVRVDRSLTRLVEDRIYGMRRTPDGMYDTTTYFVTEGAVQFRDGVRMGNPLKINADILNYLAKKEYRHGRIEEAQELYEQAVQLDPRDGRAYSGLSRCAKRRRDFKLARSYLKAGIAKSSSPSAKDKGANPFLLQSLGCLEEKMGNLGQAEALYLASVRSRPSHAAGWVSLAQLRTRKLGQSANAGRLCYQEAEQELKRAGLPPSSYVYTAWAALEYSKAKDVRRARELFRLALEVDPKCSAALLQLGTMEADSENWKEAEKCFEKVLTFDQRNSRVLQAYAIMETKRPGGNSRRAIDLFERALRANPRDAGVLQAYALYVAKLGDLDGARKLLSRGTKVSKGHAPVWQAWGVLETRHGTAETARKIFQQGIWACAQLNGDNSGGYHCARLWQAWGVLEAREGDHAAARRCFSRALDADRRNVAAVTAWAYMEVDLGNIEDARSIFERALPMFSPGSEEKISLWRSYELMEQRQANLEAAQSVYQRAIAETMAVNNDLSTQTKNQQPTIANDIETDKTNSDDREVEVVRWEGSGNRAWIRDRAIETKLPFNLINRKSK